MSSQSGWLRLAIAKTSIDEALQVVAAMQKGNVVDLTPSLAIAASKLSLAHNMPMADSIIFSYGTKI